MMSRVGEESSDNIEEIREESIVPLRNFSTRSLSNTQCLQSSVDVLKSFMVHDEIRRPFSRNGDLFLKPLPAHGYFGRPIMTSACHGVGYPFPCVHGFPPFDSCISSQLYRSRSEPTVGQLSSDSEKDDKNGILKKTKTQEIVKDITINNSLVFIPNLGDQSSDSRGISELSTKLIEDFHKLKEDGKEAKMVQFDLSSGSAVNLDKSREQYSSLSTNDSLLPASASSPTSTTSARMEWDSAADIGYIEMDMAKEKLSTLERVTLQGIARKGGPEKKVVYKKSSRDDRVLKRIPSDLIEMEERKVLPIMKETGTNPEIETLDNNTQTTDEATLTPENEPKKPKPRKTKKTEQPKNEDLDLPLPEMRDQSTLVNTLDDIILRKLSTSSEEKKSPRVKKLKKKKMQEVKLNTTSTESNMTILPCRSFESKAVQATDTPKLMSSKNIQASGELNSLPKHLDSSKLSQSSAGVRNKSTQFFGDGLHSLPRGLEPAARKVTAKKEKTVLTKKALKMHGKNADQQIVREKFFQSQMMSRSTETGHSLVGTKTVATSMTRSDHSLLDFENLPQSTMMEVPKMVTVGVQYSPKENQSENRQHRDAWTDTIDSQASSTQTAHSWVHNGAPVQESVVRPTRSFEYLPGDVYENSNNIREVLPSETSQNVITESESSAESIENRGSDSNSGDRGETLVVDETRKNAPGAWLLVKGDSVEILRNDPDNGVSEVSGKFTSSSDKQQESVAPFEKCTTAVQTDSPVEKNSELIEILNNIQAILIERHSKETRSTDKKSSATNSSYSSIYAAINKTGKSCISGKERATSTPQEMVGNSSSVAENSARSQKCSAFSGSLPSTPRIEYVSVMTQSEHNPIHHQATQMSERHASKDTATQIEATLGRKFECRQDQATQMSRRGSEKSSGKKSVRGEAAPKSASLRQMKIINGEAFSTYLDVDFSSSEVMSSGTASAMGKNGKNKATDKENIQCLVCRCRFNNQDCVFCPCHFDKTAHIPRCDCHDKIPRYLIPGFCKCHKRNLRHVNKCKCGEQHNVENNKCPCCEYFASRMRSQLLAAQIDGVKTPVTSTESAPPKNYFLKLEETEVSKDSSDVSETDRKPLEVVTIKIPVKRIGKAKIPTKQFYYSGSVQRSKHDDVEFLDDIVRKYRGVLSSRQQSTGSYKKGTTSERISVGTFSSYRTLQECLESNRPDFVNSAEYRRQMINERAREREMRQNGPKILSQPVAPPPLVAKRMFTTAELHEQTRKHYKKLPEVAQKKRDEKKRDVYRTNKLMAEIYAKKLQLKTLRGQLNFSNSCDLLTT